MWIKYPGGIIDTTTAGPTDCTNILVNLLDRNVINVFVTSGHASSHDWQLHYPTPGLEGFFRSYAGQLYGDPAPRAWIVPDRPPRYERYLEIVPGEAGRDTITFSIRMNEEAGLSRHPIVFLPYRVSNVEMIYTDAHEAIITDNFIMLYVWHSGEPSLLPGEERTVIFAADRDEECISVMLSPDTTAVDRGGILGYTVTIINTTSESQTFYGQAEVTLPGGEQYPGNPVIGPIQLTLGPGQLVERHIENEIPNEAPLGFYVYTVKIGSPSGLLDEDRFQFQVTSAQTVPQKLGN